MQASNSEPAMLQLDEGRGGVVVFLCDGATCAGRTAVRALREHLGAVVHAEGLQGRVTIDRETCFGHCQNGPNLMICNEDTAQMGPPLPGTPGAEVFHRVTLQTAIEAVRKRLGKIEGFAR